MLNEFVFAIFDKHYYQPQIIALLLLNLPGQPPLKRRLLEEFDRTVVGPRGSVLEPEISSPNGEQLTNMSELLIFYQVFN